MSFCKLVVSFLFFHYVLSENCPSREAVYPCYCSENGKEITSHCSHINSLKELRNSIKGYHGRHLSSLVIENSYFDYLPFDIFENVTIKHLKILKSNFTRIANLGEKQFQGLETSLESITILDTFTVSRPFAYVSMENLKKLKSLDLEGNYIAVVNNHWFEHGPTSLRKLRFVKGQISIVGYKAFQVLKNLEMLDISDNSITYLARSALPQPALLLQEINLERNKLESLPENIFHGMPNLKRVNLELNEFSTIDESVWRPVWCHLETLNIDYNPMICDSKIRWMYHGAESFEKKLIGTCYKPFKLMDRDLHSLTVNELQ